MYFLVLFFPILLYCLLRQQKRCRSGNTEYLLSFSIERLLPLRGVLALLIVIHHFTQQYVDQWQILEPFLGFGMPVVSTFFFISGFGICRSLQRKGDTYLDGFLRKRFASLVPPLAAVTLISWLLTIYVYKSGSWASVTLSYIRGGFPANTWFMYPLMFAYLAFYASARLFKSNILKTGVGLAAAVSGLCIALMYKGFGDIWYASTPCLAFGYFVATYEDTLRKLLRRSIMTCILFAFIPAFAFAYLSYSIPQVYILRNITIVALVYIAVCAGGTPSSMLLRTLGRYSLEIYLVHSLWLQAALTIGLAAGPAAFLIIAGTALSAVALSYIRVPFHVHRVLSLYKR